MDDKGVKSLSAAVIKLAIDDLQSMQKKIMMIKAMDRKGKLVNKIEKANYKISADEITALAFLKQGSLFFDILDMEELPSIIKEQVDYCQKNLREAQEIFAGAKSRLKHCD